MHEAEFPTLPAVSSPPARCFRPYAALALGALIAAALSFVVIKETAMADRELDPQIEELQAGAEGASIGLAGMMGGAPFLAMMDRAGASDAQILRILALADAARSDVARLTVVYPDRVAEAADAARARIDQAMTDIAAVLTSAQRARLTGETIAVPAAARGIGGRSEFSNWRGL